MGVCVLSTPLAGDSSVAVLGLGLERRLQAEIVIVVVVVFDRS